MNSKLMYGHLDVGKFCEDHLFGNIEATVNAGGIKTVVRDHIAYEAMKLYRDFGIDPVDALQAALDKIRADAQIVVNTMPAEVAK